MLLLFPGEDKGESESDPSFCRRLLDLLKGSSVLEESGKVGETAADEEVDGFWLKGRDFCKS